MSNVPSNSAITVVNSQEWGVVRLGTRDNGTPHSLHFKSGNKADFTLVFQVFYKPLCAFSNKLLRDVEGGEDLVADVFIKLWNNPGEFPNSHTLKRWLYKCTCNECLSQIKRRKRFAIPDIDYVESNNKLTAFCFC
jgi:DNA-directed RNA polymerase specialized sigma24 family protein